MELGRQMCGLVLLLIVKRTVDGLSTIHWNRRPAKGLKLTLICQDDGSITQSVDFYKNTILQGSCSTSCGAGVSGYVVSQNRTASQTSLTISFLEEPRDVGDWTCRQGTDTDSFPLKINSPMPCVIDRSTDITVTPPVSSLTRPDNISVNVSVSCCSQTASVQWTYQKQNEPPVLLDSNTTTTNESCTGSDNQTLNTFQPQRTAFLTTGIVNLTLTIEHDSFDPPDYTVVFTTLIDLGDNPTSTATPGRPTTPTPPGICQDIDCNLFLLLLLLLLFIPIIVVIIWRRRKKKKPKSNSNVMNTRGKKKEPVSDEVQVKKVKSDEMRL